MRYFDELKKSMTWLGQKNNTIFLGQAVEYPGTAMTNTLSDIKEDKLFELPVAEEMQMGMTLGMSFEGLVPISIFPRWNFVLCGMNQLVNHIDKLKYMNGENFNSTIIIRTGIGSEKPLHPQYQHIGDFTSGLKEILKEIEIIVLENSDEILNPTNMLIQKNKTTILVEYGDYYNEK